MPRALRMLRVWCVVALITIVSQGTTAYGHARREVGHYRFVVGFLVEPAYEGLKNGVDLRVLQADTEAPLEGLQDTAVQETFDSKSGGGQFDDVESSMDIQFPVRLPEMRELTNVLRGTQHDAQQAQDTALAAQTGLTSVRTFALGGVVLGALGCAIGVVAVVASRKR